MDRDVIDHLIADLVALRDKFGSRPDRIGSNAPEVREDVDRARWLAGILAHSPDVISILDTDGTLLYVSRTPTGTEAARFVGKSSAAYLPPADREIWNRALQEAIRTREPQHVELFSLGDYHWDTRIVPVEENGEVTWLLTIGTDITSQKRVEAALAVKEHQLRLALEASGMGQWSWDIATDRLTWDSASKRIFDWPEGDDDITFAAYMERVHPADRERVKSAVSAAVDTGEYNDLQCRIMLPDASVRWIVCKGKVLKDADGRTQTLVGGIVDITHGKRTDEQLQRSSKLEAIGQLAGGIAHDFNNLLVAIMGNVDLARRAQRADERNKRLNDATIAADRAAELTRELLMFSRKHPLDEDVVDFHALLTDTLRLLERLLPETIRLSLVPAPALPGVLGDRGQLEQVIVNLCVNARDAMPNGGELVIQTDAVSIDERMRESYPWARPGRYVVITVSDTGTGIAPDFVDHIFDPFFTTKQYGTGLGLATAYGIVKRHGGLIQVHSKLGNGTMFKVYLPVSENAARRTITEIEAPVRGGTETVLLAEDEDAVRSVISRILERAGYRVVATSDGVEAVLEFRRNRDAIDLLLFDAVMPNKGGIEALLEIRAMAPSVPAILCSGYSETANPWSSSGERVEFLAKPYEPDTLLRVLRRLLDERKRPEAAP